jgi:hypothetical protein
MMPTLPKWSIPENLQAILDADEDGMWEDNRWDPILLTIMKGTSYHGRAIPLVWQLEFHPDDEEFEAANKSIKSQGVDPDGYGWRTALHSAIAERYPEIVNELHFEDTGRDTCVVWVESENACRILIEVAWGLIHGTYHRGTETQRIMRETME